MCIVHRRVGNLHINAKILSNFLQMVNQMAPGPRGEAGLGALGPAMVELSHELGPVLEAQIVKAAT